MKMNLCKLLALLCVAAAYFNAAAVRAQYDYYGDFDWRRYSYNPTLHPGSPNIPSGNYCTPIKGTGRRNVRRVLLRRRAGVEDQNLARESRSGHRSVGTGAPERGACGRHLRRLADLLSGLLFQYRRRERGGVGFHREQ